MFKNFRWKYFPPKPVSDLEIECAHNEFESLRRHIGGIDVRYKNYYVNQIVENARRRYERLIVRQKDYIEYSNSHK